LGGSDETQSMILMSRTVRMGKGVALLQVMEG